MSDHMSEHGAPSSPSTSASQLLAAGATFDGPHQPRCRCSKSRHSVKKIFVGNLPWSATDQDLVDLFTQYGEVLSARVIVDRDTGRSKRSEEHTSELQSREKLVC